MTEYASANGEVYTRGATGSRDDSFELRLRWRKFKGRCFAGLCAASLLIAVAFLGLLLWQVVSEGWSGLSWKLVTKPPSRLNPSGGGLAPALWGTIWLVGVTVVFAVPVGVGAAVYLQEYARKGRFSSFVELNIANLAGVPSVVYGILGLAILVRWMGFGRSLLAGGITLGLLVLPVVITAAREAIAAVPSTTREAAYALGATRFQILLAHVLPAALPGILTGVILAVSRAIGEAAPLIVVGAVILVMDAPSGLRSEFTAVPLQVYHWSQEALPEFHTLAASGIILLLAILLPMNAVAVIVRAWQQRRRS